MRKRKELQVQPKPAPWSDRLKAIAYGLTSLYRLVQIGNWIWAHWPF